MKTLQIVLVAWLVITLTACSCAREARWLAYQRATEQLLDSIESAHGWMDTVGESDIYIDWCKARKGVQR